MKFNKLVALVALTNAIEQKSSFAPPALGPYASDTDHLSTECYGADEDDIMYDVFERYRVEEKNPDGNGTGIWKLPKYSSLNGLTTLSTECTLWMMTKLTHILL